MVSATKLQHAISDVSTHQLIVCCFTAVCRLEDTVSGANDSISVRDSNEKADHLMKSWMIVDTAGKRVKRPAPHHLPAAAGPKNRAFLTGLKVPSRASVNPAVLFNNAEIRPRGKAADQLTFIMTGIFSATCASLPAIQRDAIDKLGAAIVKLLQPIIPREVCKILLVIYWLASVCSLCSFVK